MSYRQISWSLEVARLDVIMIVSLWNFHIPLNIIHTISMNVPSNVNQNSLDTNVLKEKCQSLVLLGIIFTPRSLIMLNMEFYLYNSMANYTTNHINSVTPKQAIVDVMVDACIKYGTYPPNERKYKDNVSFMDIQVNVVDINQWHQTPFPSCLHSWMNHVTKQQNTH